jgi:hypothetical protein
VATKGKRPRRVRWYLTVATGSRGRETLYAGPNQREAEAARDHALALDPPAWQGVQVERGWEYPPPERNPDCQCRDDPLRQMLCPCGHMTECHYPRECSDARCSHLANYDEPPPDHPSLRGVPAGERTAGWLAAAIREGDRVFTDSPDAGSPACLCSRCGGLIREDDMPVRAWEEHADRERRYHPACLGLQTYHEVGDDGEEDYL